MSKIDDTSLIVGGVRKTLMISDGVLPGTSNGDTIEETMLSPRHTEVAATQPRAKSPSYLAWMCLYWARIAMQPSAYPNVNGRPERAQTGKRLPQWVGKRVGISPDRVEKYLRSVDGFILDVELRGETP